MKELESRLVEAIDFAAKQGWELYHRPDALMERIRKAKHVGVFGAGNFFQKNFSWFPELNAKCEFVCDSDPKKQNRMIAGKPCISVDELKQLDDVVVIIAVGNYGGVVKELDNIGIECYPLEYFILRTCDSTYLDRQWFQENKAAILSAWHMFEDPVSQELFVEDFCIRVAPHLAQKSYSDLKSIGQREYFYTDVVSLGNDEYFVDAGAYDGDSIRDFIAATKNSYKKIYAFELAEENFKKLKKFCADYPQDKILLFQAGVSNQKRKIWIDGSEMGWRESSFNQGKTAELVTLDAALAGQKVTFIKMDIEGSELKALTGCKQILLEQTPQLAICTYHLLSDLWRVPLFIKSVDSRYHVYLRHHSQTVWDTVCYASTREAPYLC